MGGAKLLKESWVGGAEPVGEDSTVWAELVHQGLCQKVGLQREGGVT